MKSRIQSVERAASLLAAMQDGRWHSLGSLAAASGLVGRMGAATIARIGELLCRRLAPQATLAA